MTCRVCSLVFAWVVVKTVVNTSSSYNGLNEVADRLEHHLAHRTYRASQWTREVVTSPRCRPRFHLTIPSGHRK
jgi:hypothetical protein